MKHIVEVSYFGESRTVEASSADKARELGEQLASNMKHEDETYKASYKLYRCEDDTAVIGAAIHAGHGKVEVIETGTF